MYIYVCEHILKDWKDITSVISEHMKDFCFSIYFSEFPSFKK